MSMKGHLLAAAKEVFDRWEALLAGLDEQQIGTPLAPSPWTVKDVVSHVRAWQSRSIARFEAAAQNREPEYPQWSGEKDPDAAEDPERTNAWIYETTRDQPWHDVYWGWRGQFMRLLEIADTIPERELLDSSKYPWLKGYALADVLLGTYDHHQEHLEKVQAWLQERK